MVNGVDHLRGPGMHRRHPRRVPARSGGDAPVRPDTVQQIAATRSTYEFARTGPAGRLPGPAADPGRPLLRPKSSSRWRSTAAAALLGDASARVHDLPIGGRLQGRRPVGRAPACSSSAATTSVIRAFYNTCQHRGAPVVTRSECGRAAQLRCQFHSVDLCPRRLAGQRARPARLPRRASRFADNGLRPVHVRGVARLRVRQPRPRRPDRWPTGSGRSPTRPPGSTGCARSPPAAMELACNWKIGIESNIEVYHITTVHPTTVARVARLPRHRRTSSTATATAGWSCPHLHYDTAASRSTPCRRATTPSGR